MTAPADSASKRAPNLAFAGAIAIIALAISPIGIRLATGRVDLTPRVVVLSLTFDAVLIIIAAAAVCQGRLRRALFYVLAVISPLLLLALAEVAAVGLRLADRIAPLEDLSTLANKDGWPLHFMSGTRKMQKDGLQVYRPWRGDGIVINELGLRTAMPATKRAEEWRIAMTGASVAFGWRVRDADTIPVQLQEVLHRQGFTNVTVYNFAIDSLSMVDELALLKRFRDIYGIDQVVFLTGANDVTLSYMSKTATRDHGGVLVGINQFELLRLAGRLNALWFAPSPALLAQLDNVVIPELARRNSLRDSANAAAGYCRAAVLTCDVVLQPALLRRRTPSGPEIRIDRTLRQVYPRYDQMFASMYRSAASAAARVHDASDVFDQSDKPYFVDVTHLNEAANQLLAERIAGIASGSIPRSQERSNGRR